MKFPLKIVAYISIIFISLFLIYFFRDVPSVKIWDSYRIFYIEKSTDIKSIIKDYDAYIISKYSQEYPSTSSFTPIMMDFTIKNFSSDELRNIFFTDKYDKYQLVYVEDSFAETFGNILTEKKVSFGIDSNASVPIACPIVCFTLIVLLYVLSKSNLKFLFAKIPFVLLAYALPYYSVAIAICCVITYLFILEFYKLREKWFRDLKYNVSIIVFGLICFLLIALCGFKAIIFFTLSIISSELFVILTSLCNKKYIYGFSMKQILPIKYLKIEKRLNLKYLSISLASILVLFLLFCFSPKLKNNIKENNLFLPAPSEYNETVDFTNIEENYNYVKSFENQIDVETLPNIFDFVDESWIIATYPYKKISQSIDSNVSFGDKIMIPEYQKTSDGLVVQKSRLMYNFNEEFIDNLITEYSNSSGIEKLLASQQFYTNVVYSSGGNVKNSTLMWVVSILGVFIVGSFTFFCLIKGYFNKRQSK